MKIKLYSKALNGSLHFWCSEKTGDIFLEDRENDKYKDEGIRLISPKGCFLYIKKINMSAFKKTVMKWYKFRLAFLRFQQDNSWKGRRNKIIKIVDSLTNNELKDLLDYLQAQPREDLDQEQEFTMD